MGRGRRHQDIHIMWSQPDFSSVSKPPCPPFSLRVLRAMFPSSLTLTSYLSRAGKERCVFLFKLVQKPLSH
jgi:hypothetical protein